MKLAFVIPRFAQGLVGGAERLALELIGHLPRDRFETEVWTTCALDHHSWADHFPEGEERIGDLVVRRFRTNPRDLARFVHLQQRLHGHLPLDLDDELAWLAHSVNSDGLIEHLARRGGERDALLFLPYLFGVTLTGVTVHPERSVLVPCLHDEPYAYLRIVRHAFEVVAGVLFNSSPERDLARRVVGLDDGKSAVVGMGFDPPATRGDGARFRRRLARERPGGVDGDYVLYFGRKEDGKNTGWLAAQFLRWARRADPRVTLVFAGSGQLDLERGAERWIVDVDYLDEDEKRDAIAGALAVCQPSVNESFSIVLMEAWLAERPVLVHARCPVTRTHALEAGGGLWFETAEELGACIEFLRQNPETARRMGRGGRAYVERDYAWPAVLGRFEAALERFVG